MSAETESPPPAGRRPHHHRPDGIVTACVVLLLAFPLACAFVAARQPDAPAGRDALAPVAAHGAGGRLTDLPALAARGRTPRAVAVGDAAIRADVEIEARRLLGRAAAARFGALLEGPAIAPPAGVRHDRYPYRYRGLDALLDRALGAQGARPQEANDLGALLVAAAAHDAYPNAGRAAFAVLHRARRSRGGPTAGTCLPQLNLAFTVAASEATPATKARELRRAEAGCPRDPTASWLQGQWQSVASWDHVQQGEHASTALALATFRRLQRRFPRSAAGWSGEADALLRQAYVDDAEHRPFTARNRYSRALALLRRARTLDPDRRLAAGEARALDALGRHAAAARVQEPAARVRHAAALQARLVEYLEHAGAFGRAAAQARRLATGARFAPLSALFVEAQDPVLPLAEQDALEPLSLGAARLRPVRLTIEPANMQGGVLPVSAVEDIGFIPAYRDIGGVTGTDRWCPAWAARRDLVLAGRPGEALEGMPASFRGIRPTDDTCQEPSDITRLTAVAEAENGMQAAAVTRLRAARKKLSPAGAVAELYEARQNMWRFAKRYERAREVARAWAREQPVNPDASDRRGEIAYLTGDFRAAARMFAGAARLRRERTAGWSAAEALELVKRGAALKRAGRLNEALTVLGAADEVASRALAAGDDEDAPIVIYRARAQAGDAMLRLRRYDDADELYGAARGHLPEGDVDEPRIEALDNNQSLARAYAGRPGPALRAARRAVAVDPMNPIFLQTEALALARLRQPLRSAAVYRRAVTSDPTLFAAWNDLGVQLARAGRDRDAAAALRRSIGIRRDYAPAWFNLAIVLSADGVRHLAAAQGALGRAFRLDPDLRDRERELVANEALYFSDLDLSKPLPPELDLDAAQSRSPLPATGLALLLLIGLQGARAVAARGLIGGAKRWLEAARTLLARLPGALASFAPSAIAVVVTVAVLGWPDVHGSNLDATEIAILVLGLLALVAIVMRVRVLAARAAGVRLRQRAWNPALLVGVAGAAAGIPWAPLPVAEPDEPAPSVHRDGPIAAASIGLALLILNALLQVPVTQSLGVAAIVMAASMLTPVAPLDGAKMTGGATAATAGLAVAGTAVLVVLGLQ